MATALFLIQTICTLVFGGSQFVQLLYTTQSVSVTWYASWLVFLVLNVAIEMRAHHNSPSKSTHLSIFSYLLWTAVVMLDMSVIVWRGIVRWSDYDVLTIMIVLAGMIVTLGASTFFKRGIFDPIVHGLFATFFKTVPQCIMAYTILQKGREELTAVAIVVGHITILTRLGQLAYSIRVDRQERNRIWSAISEVGNWLSWLLVTLAWLAR